MRLHEAAYFTVIFGVGVNNYNECIYVNTYYIYMSIPHVSPSQGSQSKSNLWGWPGKNRPAAFWSYAFWPIITHRVWKCSFFISGLFYTTDKQLRNAGYLEILISKKVWHVIFSNLSNIKCEFKQLFRWLWKLGRVYLAFVHKKHVIFFQMLFLPLCRINLPSVCWCYFACDKHAICFPFILFKKHTSL